VLTTDLAEGHELDLRAKRIAHGSAQQATDELLLRGPSPSRRR
jgi:hypothetical protein